MDEVLSYPPVPLWHRLRGNLQPGKMVEIRGTVPYGADSFQVNFTEGMDSGSFVSDRLLHLSIRFNDKIVVRNTHVYGAWENEERSPGFPFGSGQHFVMLILVEADGYKIAVNGQHYWEFRHRHAVDRVNMVYVDGSVRVDELRIFDKYGPTPTGTVFPGFPGARSPMETITNPNIPFTGQLPGNLDIGKTIEIQGFVPYGADVFTVNLVKSQGQDTPLHISVRFNGCIVVRNSFRFGSWEQEERTGRFPFSQGASFSMVITLNNNAYQIAVNGCHCWEFCHRFSYQTVKMLAIDGTVRINEIQYRNFRQNQPVITYPTAPAPMTLQPVVNPAIPYVHAIPQGLRPGMLIYISGRPKLNANKFTINLSRSHTRTQDIAFHFDARFQPRTIVRNTQTNGRWGQEEKSQPYFPFMPCIHFDLIIMVEPDKFMVAINGRHFFHYQHRVLPLNLINRLHVENDVHISTIRFSGA